MIWSTALLLAGRGIHAPALTFFFFWFFAHPNFHFFSSSSFSSSFVFQSLLLFLFYLSLFLFGPYVARVWIASPLFSLFILNFVMDLIERGGEVP